MSILVALTALLFGLACLSAVAVLVVSGRRAIAAWAELSRALDTGNIRTAKVANRPQLRLVEGGVRPLVAGLRLELREAA